MRPALRRSLIAVAVAALAAGGVAVYWHWAAERLETAIAEWTAAQRERGYEIAYDGPLIEGFPTRLAARFDAPKISSPGAASGDGWRWAGPPVAGEAKLWAPLTIELRFPGRHEIARRVGGVELPATLAAKTAAAVIELGIDGHVERAHLTLIDPSWDDPVTGQITAKQLLAAFGSPLAAGRARQDYLPLMAVIHRLELPEHLQTPLGRRVPEVRIDAMLRGTPPPGPPPAALAAWRDAGGVLELHNGVLQWGPLTLSGDGTLTLDQELRPLGALSARIRGLGAALDKFADAGLIERGQAIAIELAATALAGERDESGEQVVVLPLTLQDGWLYLGPVRLFPLSPVL
ncbi:MAG: DUF2125 domain-containing protein [Kiloniellales bacterium]